MASHFHFDEGLHESRSIEWQLSMIALLRRVWLPAAISLAAVLGELSAVDMPFDIGRSFSGFVFSYRVYNNQ